MALVKLTFKSSTSYPIYINPKMVIYIRRDPNRTGIHLAGGGGEGGVFVAVEESIEEVANLISAQPDR
ncbi:hypothetical protein [Rhizobium sp. BK376]|uniref:hypothetical protein n=1 Tax=Rhizobium sp. BK376 TaxID=2512149 RepID=UPI00105025FD|nr:hypothetical protein [Rhizobium sp. BK376]TCR65962.1 hypothetical protein EV561_15512 [Rhizobium sp. BK376]